MGITELEERLFERNARRIWNVGAFDSNHKDPWILRSRKISPVYVNCGEFQNYPVEWEGVIADVSEYLSKFMEANTIDRISGGELRDLLFSIPVALRLGLPHVTIRKEAKGYGLKDRIVGKVKQGERVLPVADLRTTGESEISWIEVIRAAGGVVDFSFSYFDRLQGGEALQKEGVKSISLVQMTDAFFRIGRQEERLSISGYNELGSYLSDKEKWAVNFLRGNPDYIKQHLTESVLDGKLKNRAPIIRVLTKVYPMLKEEFTSQVCDWLAELGVNHPVPEIGYEPK